MSGFDVPGSLVSLRNAGEPYDTARPAAATEAAPAACRVVCNHSGVPPRRPVPADPGARSISPSINRISAGWCKTMRCKARLRPRRRRDAGSRFF